MRFNKPLYFLLVWLAACKPNFSPEPKIRQAAIASPPEVAKDSLRLVSEKGLVFYKNQPFSGISVQDYPDGNREETIEYLHGKPHGKNYKWFKNGLKSYEATYQNGALDGTVFSWWENGNLRSQSSIANGLLDGVQWQWYKSGKKFKKITLVNGQEEGLQQSWRENGKIYNNYEARNGRTFGLKRTKLCYELDNEKIK